MEIHSSIATSLGNETRGVYGGVRHEREDLLAQRIQCELPKAIEEVEQPIVLPASRVLEHNRHVRYGAAQ
jgi:hypothetical protein